MGALLRSARFHAILLSEDVAYEAKDKIDHSIFNSSCFPLFLALP